MSAILSVSELTRAVKDLLEAEFPFVWVRGQITNLGRPASGHLYFSLTDGDSLVNVVWFKGAQRSAEPVSRGGEAVNPLTGEVEEEKPQSLADALEDGMEVLCAGRLNVYEPRGQYQLVAELVQEQGVGDLRMAFEAMKRKLAAKGYFEEDRKMQIPREPARVAVVTSPTGAAIRDFLRIASTRGVGSEIRIQPTAVQGEAAPEQIAAALDAVGDEGWADVVVLIRGGGSLEDLWAFNTEVVGEAIYRSRIPVVCGVGHEPDVSIADYVADLRVATPSHAAQVIWKDRDTMLQEVDRLEMDLTRAYLKTLDGHEHELKQLRRALAWLSPVRRLDRSTEQVRSLALRLERLGRAHYESRREQAARWTGRLTRAFGTADVERAVGTLQDYAERMRDASLRRVEDRGRELELAKANLAGLDPEAPLQRGYSLIRIGDDGPFLRSPDEVADGDRLSIRVRDGNLAARVEKEGPEG
ncbi:exodeoxyribonuclease VII large subunit [Desulfovibrio oxyclinae]|uniref:exodeoxyribonuclease VII large subunit n=1 Tax=Desulfovibrio oxyclinae TaxID=63560 RepID=UPI0003610685|nr:exodeoxyribonuclease VII large subunit [Desulfovibrio oxyclinae]